MNIIKRLNRAAWFSLETFVDAVMARGFGVYSYPPPSPEPVRSDPHRVVARVTSAANEGRDSLRSLRRQYEDTLFPVEIGELRRPHLLEASKNERINAIYRKASIDAPLEPSRQNHLRMVWIRTGRGLGCHWVDSPTAAHPALVEHPSNQVEHSECRFG